MGSDRVVSGLVDGSDANNGNLNGRMPITENHLKIRRLGDGGKIRSDGTTLTLSLSRYIASLFYFNFLILWVIFKALLFFAVI